MRYGIIHGYYSNCPTSGEASRVTTYCTVDKNPTEEISAAREQEAVSARGNNALATLRYR